MRESRRLSAYLADQLAAGGYADRQFLGQTVDEWMVEPFFFRALRHFWNIFEDGVRDFDDASCQRVGIDADTLGEFLPLIFADIPQAVFISDFH
jgi:hypothetical protein